MNPVGQAPIEQFDFAKSEDWPKWIRRFERFRSVSGLATKEQPAQIDALIFYMGDEAEDVFASFGLTEDEKKLYDTVVKKFKEHFVIKHNVVYESFLCFERRQKEGESIEEFVTSLYRLSEHCEFGELRDRLIRDRIVCGIRDKVLSERLQLISDLTLDKAVTMTKQTERVKKQNPILHGEQEAKKVEVDWIQTRQDKKKEFWRQKTEKGSAGRQQSGKQSAGNSKTSSGDNQCGRCGNGSHGAKDCPAAKY